MVGSWRGKVKMRAISIAGIALAATITCSGLARAGKDYGPGVTDAEIKLGQIMPYSGPASAFGANGLTTLAYLKMINLAGGVNGRQIRLIPLDDGYNPSRTVE
jgi:branched-chain amino acid transport system substrate-binding protein